MIHAGQRVVPIDEWKLGQSLAPRRARLTDVLAPIELAEAVSRESQSNVASVSNSLFWQESCESPGYFRIVAQIPLSEETFDQFFNGRSGYRAQYYLSPEEGVLFNRYVIESLTDTIFRAFALASLDIDFDRIESSLLAPHSKLWVFGEKEAFDQAEPETLNPQRWVSNHASRGRRAPLPDHRSLDLKGAFIRPKPFDLFIDDLKLERPCDLFNRGYT